jgi:amidase
MSDPAFLGAAEAARRIARGELRSRELLEQLAQRVEQFNPQLNAVVTLDLEHARAAADAADAAVARGAPLGPLHGVPMTIKDSFETADLRTTSGSPTLAHHVPAADAVAVARLKAAGAIVFGKTNLPAFAMDTQSYNALFGVCRNPWDPQRSPGGSSGGSAAALAAGLTPLELGSDIGGSIRNPAHWCGVFGHKPSWGLVPQRGHIPGPPGTLSGADIAVVGPMARHAADLTLALDLLVGPDEPEARAWRLQLPPARRDARALRVAAWFDEPALPIDAEVRVLLERAVAALRDAGVRVDAATRPGFETGRALALYWQLLFAATSPGLPPPVFDMMLGLAGQQAAAARDNGAADAPMRRMAVAATQRHRDWLRANEQRLQLRARWGAFFRDVDVLLCPVSPTAAIAHDHSEPIAARSITVDGQELPYLDQLGWAGLIGVAGLPSTSVPVGRTAGGLPVGVQVVGPFLEDHTPLAMAALLEDLLGGFVRPPGY